MTNKRRAFLIVTSVLAGTLVSAFIMKKKYGVLSGDKYMLLLTNLIISLAVIVGIGLIVSRSKKP